MIIVILMHMLFICLHVQAFLSVSSLFVRHCDDNSEAFFGICEGFSCISLAHMSSARDGDWSTEFNTQPDLLVCVFFWDVKLESKNMCFMRGNYCTFCMKTRKYFWVHMLHYICICRWCSTIYSIKIYEAPNHNGCFRNITIIKSLILNPRVDVNNCCS